MLLSPQLQQETTGHHLRIRIFALTAPRRFVGALRPDAFVFERFFALGFAADALGFAAPTTTIVLNRRLKTCGSPAGDSMALSAACACVCPGLADPAW